MAKYVVAQADEIPAGNRLIVTVAGRSIGIFNLNGDYYALRNSCIHNQAPVCLGEVSGTLLPSAPGEYRQGMEGQILRCPWHGWEFDITSGCSLFDPNTKINTYPVSVEEGAIVVEIGGGGS